MGGLLHLVQRRGAWAGCGPAHVPRRCTKRISPTINGQCTSYVLLNVTLQLPLHSNGLMSTDRGIILFGNRQSI